MADVVTNIFMLNRPNVSTGIFRWVLCRGPFIEDDLKKLTSITQLSAVELVNANGYVTGGVTVTATMSIDTLRDEVVVGTSEPAWAVSGGVVGPFRYAALYDATSGDVLYIYDWKKDQMAVDGASIRIRISSDGLVRLSRTCP